MIKGTLKGVRRGLPPFGRRTLVGAGCPSFERHRRLGGGFFLRLSPVLVSELTHASRRKKGTRLGAFLACSPQGAEGTPLHPMSFVTYKVVRIPGGCVGGRQFKLQLPQEFDTSPKSRV